MRSLKAGSGSNAAAALLVMLMAFSVGCSLHSGKLPTGPDGPDRAVVSDVPFYAQEQYLCGPATLAMALTWSGVKTDPDALVDQVYTPDRKGSFQSEMITAARRHGRIAYPVRGADQLVAELARGKPVVVLQNLGLSWLPRWHYAVVIGYDRGNNKVLLHSGTYARLERPFPVFENTWARSDFWGLLVMPPDTLPATAEETDWLKAAVGLERVKRIAEARTAYETATRRWPESHDAWMGVGNTAYALGEKGDAAAAFTRAARIRPADGLAFNNLAHVLSEMGEHEQAVDAATRAVAAGGPHVDVFRRTLAKITQASQASAP